MSNSQSHPAVKFEKLPVVTGPLSHFEKNRAALNQRVIEKSVAEILQSANAGLDLVLGQALYGEKLRLKRDRGNLFTRRRLKGDRKLWGEIQAGLLASTAEVDRKKLLHQIVEHYVEEISGHFDPKIYRLATNSVPLFFNWLLNAASINNFLPWKMRELLASRLTIQGEISQLQKLAEKGTILLVPTHQSNIDSVLIGYVIYLLSLPPFSYGAGLNLFTNPALSFFMGNLGAYTVDRQKNNEIYKATLKHYSTEILKSGIHSIFFPGGGRARSGAVESKLKLGLLGTALQAQLENHMAGVAKPNVYVVPMVTSYHFVLEANSLVEDHLAEAGKHRFIITDDESWNPLKILKFFWKLFSSKTGVTVRVGRALDIFGNFVDDEGRSRAHCGNVIDPSRWLKTQGELKADPQRDHEFTKELGKKIVERYHRENTVLSSHAVAFVLFETLRKKYPDLDLYRFLRLSLSQRSLPLEEFLSEAKILQRRLEQHEARRELFICEEIKKDDSMVWIEAGIKNLGLFHEAAVVKFDGRALWTEDMNLLYYYRNRLCGYGLTLLANQGRAQSLPGQSDAKGFLA